MSRRNTSKGDDEPKSFKEVLMLPTSKKKQWIEACESELAEIKLQQVYEIVPRPPSQKVLTSRWVFKNKKDQAGAIVKRKARLVARGFEQRFGADFTATFASVAKSNTLKLLTALAAQRDLEVYQMDMITAFLQTDGRAFTNRRRKAWRSAHGKRQANTPSFEQQRKAPSLNPHTFIGQKDDKKLRKKTKKEKERTRQRDCYSSSEKENTHACVQNTLQESCKTSYIYNFIAAAAVV